MVAKRSTLRAYLQPASCANEYQSGDVGMGMLVGSCGRRVFISWVPGGTKQKALSMHERLAPLVVTGECERALFVASEPVLGMGMKCSIVQLLHGHWHPARCTFPHPPFAKLGGLAEAPPRCGAVEPRPWLCCTEVAMVWLTTYHCVVRARAVACRGEATQTQRENTKQIRRISLFCAHSGNRFWYCNFRRSSSSLPVL
jgi:hypothetical protein